MTAERTDFATNYLSRQHYYRTLLARPPETPALTLMKILGENTYKAIVVYPEAVDWEPQQRPQHLLREMAARGYLCFFCESSKEPFEARQIEPNLYVLRRGEAELLSALRSQSVIVLCTWIMQMALGELFPHRTVWYDILDDLTFFSQYDEGMLQKHRELLQRADVVTYSARKLLSYAESRADALYLPNAARLEDFADIPAEAPDDLKPILASGSPIIGYFGAIEPWFDAKLVAKLAQKRPDWQFVLIGKIGIDPGKLAQSNIHLMGFKMYKQIRHYARYFHAAVIPFLVNEVTDRVSPVKFFEYAALGLPVVSAPIAEMTPYASPWMRIASGANAFLAELDHCLKEETARLAKTEAVRFAREQTWAKRLEKVEERLTAAANAWKAYANYDPAGKVAVMATTFLDFEGERFYSGGAERYLIDLGRLCERMGLGFVIYQYGNYPWVRRIRDIDVVSLSRGGQHAREFTFSSVKMFNRLFREQTAERALLAVYSAYFNSWPHGTATPSIGIIHGVSWDNPAAKYKDGSAFWEINRRFIEGARICGELVSVDTNSANWFQTIDYELGRKIKVIPNYVDAEAFSPRKGFLEPRDRTVILYPRRLYKPRGLYMTLDAVDRILEKYPSVDFHFVGNGDAADTVHVEEKIRKWGSRIRLYSLPLEEMASAYRQADIALIPTLFSEGTSLSCLEAMACGNAVIATRIGGLPDLVIHDYNGLLIEPNTEALVAAIEELLNAPVKMAVLKRRAAEVASVFSKRRWESKWSDIIRPMVEASSRKPGSSAGKARQIEIYLNDVPAGNGKLGATIVSLLSRGHLVYLRLKTVAPAALLSFGRLQWMNWSTAVHSKPDLILALKEIRDDIGRPVDGVLNAKGEWEWTSSYPRSLFEPDPR